MRYFRDLKNRTHNNNNNKDSYFFLLQKATTTLSIGFFPEKMNSANNFFFIVTCILAVVGVSSAWHYSDAPTPSPLPSPAVDCTSLMYNMADCISYLSVGSKNAKPTSSCCSGLKTVVDADAECICEALKSSADLGIEVDMKRAAALPSACGVSALPLSICHMASSPVPSDFNSPTPAPDSPKIPAPDSPSPSSPKPPAPTPPAATVPAVPAISGGGGTKQAPAPSPIHSKAHSTALSAALYFLMAMVSFSFISA